MKLTFLFLCCCLLTFSGCKDGKESRQDNQYLVIAPAEPSDYISDVIPYIDTIIAVPLETTPESLISHVSKMLIRSNGDIIISTPPGLLVYNKDGKYQYTIGKRGRGPEEYVGAADICLSQDQKILNVLTINEEVISYNAETGAFIRKVVPQYPEKHTYKSAIASGPAGSIYVYSFKPNPGEQTNSTCSLHHFNTQGQLLKSHTYPLNQPADLKLITQSYDNRYILRPQYSDNICYYLSDSLPDARIKIDFGKRTLPENYSRELQTYLRSDYNKMPIDIQETADQFFFTFCGPQALEHYCLYSFPSKKVITWKRTGEDSNALFLFQCSDKEYFYGIYDDYRSLAELPLNDIDLLKKAVVQKTHIELPEDSNPYLIKIKFKNV